MVPNFYGPGDVLIVEISLCNAEAHSMNVRALFFLSLFPFCLKVTSLWHSCQASHLVMFYLFCLKAVAEDFIREELYG